MNRSTTAKAKAMRKYLVGGFAALSLVVIAACGGNSSNQPGVPYPAAQNLGSAPLSTAAPATISMATAPGLGTGTITLKGTGTVAATQSTKNPTGVAALSKKSLKGAATVAQATADPNTGIAYITLSAGNAASITSIVGVSVTPTGTIPAAPYYEAYWNGTQWVTIGSACTLASGIISCGTVTFSTPVSIPSGGNYYIAIYSGVLLTTPTPPPPAPVASPSSITLSLQTSGHVYITTNPNSTVTAVSADTSIVTVSPAATSDPTGKVDFTLTASNTKVGVTNVTFTDAIGQTTKVQVTTTNSYAPPSPSQNNIVFSLGSQTTLTVTTKPNTQVSAASSDASVLTVNSSATSDNTGTATFTVTAAGPGAATITFTDSFAQTGAFSGTVSGVKNGAFTSGLANWSTCSYAHAQLTAPVNEATPVPVNPVATQSPAAGTTPIPSPNTALTTVVTPPPNDNPSPPAGIGATPAPVLGSTVASVALIGTLDESVVNQPRGEYGICQAVSVSSKAPDLWFWVYEGGSQYNFKSADSDAAVLDQSGNLLQTLFAEQHCYIHPGTIGSPGLASQSGTSTSGCWPKVYGGDNSTSGPFQDWIAGGYWYLRGPIDLSSYATGTPVQLYFGNWSNNTGTSANFSAFMFLGNIELLPSGVSPTVAPLVRQHASIKVQLHPR